MGENLQIFAKGREKKSAGSLQAVCARDKVGEEEASVFVSENASCDSSIGTHQLDHRANLRNSPAIAHCSR